MGRRAFSKATAVALFALAVALSRTAAPAAGPQQSSIGGAEPCRQSPICAWGRERDIIPHEVLKPDLNFTYAYPFALPEGGGGVAAVAINSRGHLFAFCRNVPGNPTFFEFS